ncbi:MAG: hypothetical protein ACTTKI_08165 [Tannerella sp.]|uniref:hypothetical protein n=1 Tax=Tannerella sp. TaxID=2382127 RepID=UPI003FA2E46E
MEGFFLSLTEHFFVLTWYFSLLAGRFFRLPFCFLSLTGYFFVLPWHISLPAGHFFVPPFRFFVSDMTFSRSVVPFFVSDGVFFRSVTAFFSSDMTFYHSDRDRIKSCCVRNVKKVGFVKLFLFPD